MPKFYFDTKNDEELSQDDAFEFSGVDQAGKEAIRYLAEAAVQHITHFTPSLVCTVKDEDKRPLLPLKLILETESPQRASPRDQITTLSELLKTPRKLQ